MRIPATNKQRHRGCRSRQRREDCRFRQRRAWAFGLLVVVGLLAWAGCGPEVSPSRPEDPHDGCGAALLLPPTQAWPADVNAALGDPTETWVYRLGGGATDPYKRRPAPGDSAGLWAAGASAAGGPIALEIDAVPAGSWMRLFVRQGPLAAGTTFWLSPADRVRTVVLALARSAAQEPRIVGYRGMRAGPTTSPPMLPRIDGQPPAMLFAIAVENPEALNRIAMRFLTSNADSVQLYVDPGSRLHAAGAESGFLLRLLPWEADRAGEQLYTLQIDPREPPGTGAQIAPGSDVLFHIQAVGSDVDTALGIDPTGVLFCQDGGDACYAPEVISPGTFSFPVTVQVAVTSPSAGAAFCPGDFVSVQWELAGDMGLGVEIALLRDGEPWGEPLGRVLGATTFSWPALAATEQVTGLAMQVRELGSGIAAASGEFSVDAQCALDLVAPVGGETFVETAEVEILWDRTTCCGPGVSIELLRDGAVQVTLGDSVANTGRFVWPAAQFDSLAAGYQVRLTDLHSGVTAVSAGAFMIRRACRLAVGAPTGGEQWIAGETHEIAWDADGACGMWVRIELLAAGVVHAVIADSAANSGQYSWVVAYAGGESSDLTVRVTDLASGAAAASEASFSIRQPCTLALTFPAGGEQFTTGELCEIAWSALGACGQMVTIELLHAGQVCEVLAAATPNDGSFGWQAQPCVQSETGYQIRITDLDSGVQASSAAPFDIHPFQLPCTVTMVSPIGGETWVEGDVHDITWVAEGACGPLVRIELLRSGSVCGLIADSTANDGHHAWTTAPWAGAGGEYAVRVTDLSSASSGSSAAEFTIAPRCVLTVSSPNGAETWVEGAVYSITWDAAGACGEAVRLELLRNGEVCLTVAASTENDGHHPWIAARCGADTAGYNIRVTDLTSEAADESDATFAIVPLVIGCAVTVTYPGDGEIWVAGQEYAIGWTAQGACGSACRIELLHDGAVCAVIADSTANDGSHRWVAAPWGAHETGYAVRVMDLESGAHDDSEGHFTILAACTLSLTAPNGGEAWTAGEVHLISWSAQGACGTDVAIDLLFSGTACANITGGTENDGLYEWVTTPCTGDEYPYAIRITDLQSQQTASSAAPFSIRAACDVEVITPNGGEAWVAGDSVTVAWRTEGACGSAVGVELLRQGVVCRTLSESVTGRDTLIWIAEQCDQQTSAYRIRVQDLASGIADESDGDFSISGACGLTITAPNGGEELLVGSEYAVTWESSGACGDWVRIELLHDGDACLTLAASAPNTGILTWTSAQCDTFSSGYRVQITDLQTAAQDESDAVFSIAAPCQITISSPHYNAQWIVGETHVIEWSAPQPCGARVAIDLLRLGTPCMIIAGNVPNDGDYPWVASRCGEHADGYRIRITDITSQRANLSPPFRLLLPCTIELTAPHGGEEWFVGEQQAITWNTEETCGPTVIIELLNAGAVCHTIAAAAANSGTYEWTVEQCGGLEDAYQIRVTDPQTGMADTSDDVFRIMGPIILVRPDGTGAYPTIQAAIDGVTAGAVIYLADGAFAGEGNRDLDFRGKAITVRSYGGQAAACSIDCGGSEQEPHRGLYFHSGETPAAVLEDVSIVGGWHLTHGGGICCEGSSPTIRGCVIAGNYAGNPALPGSGRGGGVACREMAAPAFSDCEVRENSAYLGGGMACETNAAPTWSACVIHGNTAVTAGGLWCEDSAPLLADCLISENGASDLGGAMAGVSSAPQFTRCGFVRNSALSGGGGHGTQSHLTLVGCTLFENSAAAGGCLVVDPSSVLALENTIIAFTLAGEAIECEVDGQATLTCCDLYGNAGGDWIGCVAGLLGVDGNIAEDPLFCDPANLDLRLQATSPCAPFSPPNPTCDLIGAYPVGCAYPSR